MTDPERNLDPPNYPEKQDSSEYLSVWQLSLNYFTEDEIAEIKSINNLCYKKLTNTRRERK